MLAIRDLSSGEIADRFEISAPAVSQHLSVLKEAGIVRVSVEAQRRIYHLELAGFIELELWLQKHQEVLVRTTECVGEPAPQK